MWYWLGTILACLFCAFLGAGYGYNLGMAEQIPEAKSLLERVEAERRRIRNLTASARRAGGDV